ncbi:prolyl oligopeptidase family serine peptidase, partial [candidate division KSB1 bacterium]
YIQEGNNLVFLNDGKRFLWTSEVSGWNEIYLYDLSGKLIKQLTDKKLPVGGIARVDEENEWVYFTGYETRGCESHLYRVKFDGSKFKKLTKKAGSHNVSVSPGGKYFTDNFSSWDDPAESNLYRGDGKLIKELGKSVITDELKNLKLVKPEHFTFKSADGKDDIDAILYKPADFDPNKKYPVIYGVYGGPGARMIRNSWNMTDGDQQMAQLGFLILKTDHSGVSRRGKAFETKMYMKMGQVELADHTAAVKHISKRKYVDASRVGIYGHSYGGYMTCIALLKEPDVFHVGVAGAPVTHWRNYDSIYTERFMRRPQDNPEGYELGSCMKYASNLKGKLFIHHGAVDDNVHPGNTMQLVDALLKAGKRFEMKIYPEQRHGIRYSQYPQDRLDYFVRHLKPETFDEWFNQENEN